MAHVALAQAYVDANRGAQAVRMLQDAQTKFPADPTPSFELGAVLEKQKKFTDAEAGVQAGARARSRACARLNYLGYMLAERGERLDESVGYLKRALAIEPDNGSYLDSLGWAYFKDGQLDLAADNLKRAAEQLTTNSSSRITTATCCSSSDATGGDRRLDARAVRRRRRIDRGDIDKKIRSARQKLPKK